MTVRDRVDRRAPASDHIVQFFDSDESRADSVAAFLSEGLRQGEPLIVIARPANWSAIMERLQDEGIPARDLLAQGTLVVKDALDTLRRLTRTGSLDPEVFDAVITRPVKAMAGHGRVRAYGEMVDLLAQRTEFAEAIALEELWNGLAARVPLYLMCGYCAAHFVSSNTHRAMRQICGAHDEVHRSGDDPLATWLLGEASAHPPLHLS